MLSLYYCALKMFLIERRCPGRSRIKKHWQCIRVSYAGLRSPAFRCAIFGCMLVLYRAEQGYESRTQPQLQLRRRGFFSLSTWPFYLWSEHHAVCAICNVIRVFINTLLTTTQHCGMWKLQYRWREGGSAWCVVDTLLCLCHVATFAF